MRGTRAYFTINSEDTSSWIPIAFSAAQVDNISAYGITGFTIPAGVSKICLSAMVRRNTFTGNNQFSFFKNGLQLTEGAGGAGRRYRLGYLNNGSSMQTGVIDVVEGDVFSSRVFASSTPNFVGWVELRKLSRVPFSVRCPTNFRAGNASCRKVWQGSVSGTPIDPPLFGRMVGLLQRSLYRKRLRAGVPVLAYFQGSSVRSGYHHHHQWHHRRG